MSDLHRPGPSGGLAGFDLTVRYHAASRDALQGVSAAAVAGRLTAVVGPNGSGKTSLLRALLGSVTPVAGRVELEGRPIAEWKAPERARRIGFVAQREEYPFAWRAREVVGFGRYAWIPSLAPLRRVDHEAISRAMRRADVEQLADRRIDTLSGGEWQRVRIARALAQEAKILILDEPTAALDLAHEMEVFELVRELTTEGMACIVVTHELNLAARFADELLMLSEGRMVARGTPAEVFEVARLESVLGWPVELARVDGRPQVIAKRKGGGKGQGGNAVFT
jgi:iron complex transport system ATP-binding protein